MVMNSQTGRWSGKYLFSSLHFIAQCTGVWVEWLKHLSNQRNTWSCKSFIHKMKKKHIFYIFMSRSNVFYFRPGPWVESTKGEIWPKPKVQKLQQEFFSLRSSSLKFEVRKKRINISFMQISLKVKCQQYMQKVNQINQRHENYLHLLNI